jgi:hypothetical protein
MKGQALCNEGWADFLFVEGSEPGFSAQSNLHVSAMYSSRVALLACVLVLAVASVSANDPCALPANVGRAWIGNPSQYVLLIFPACFRTDRYLEQESMELIISGIF